MADSDDIRAAIVGAGVPLVDGAAEQLAVLLAPDLYNIAAVLAPGVIRARLGEPRYAHFVQQPSPPPAPTPGSVSAIAAEMQSRALGRLRGPQTGGLSSASGMPPAHPATEQPAGVADPYAPSLSQYCGRVASMARGPNSTPVTGRGGRPVRTGIGGPRGLQ